MRWAPAEDFMELKVMPRMLLDHLPDNVYKVLDTILREQKDNVSEIIWKLTFLREAILVYKKNCLFLVIFPIKQPDFVIIFLRQKLVL